MTKYSKSKSDAARGKERGPDGKFVKGADNGNPNWVKGMASPNPNGRPKKEKVGDNDLPSDFHSEVGADAAKALEKLLSTATTRYEATKLAKELLPYQKPKLSNIESHTTEVKTIEIKWVGELEPVTIDGVIEDATI